MFQGLLAKQLMAARHQKDLDFDLGRPEGRGLTAFDGWVLHLGDCLRVLERMPPGCVDLIFADPPYLLSNGGTTMSGGKRVAVDKGAWDRGRGGVDAEHAWSRRWLALAQRVLRPSGSIWVCGNYQSIPSVGYAMQSLGYHVLNLVTWQKPNPPGNLCCRMFTHSTEMLVWASPRELDPMQHTFNYDELKAENGDRQMKDVWTFGPPSPMERRHGEHTTQKPEELLDRVLKACTKPGMVVLDPFNGSGTTGVVARRRGCSFIGIELERAYFDLAARRMRADAAPVTR